ncbi:hypothetical protein KKC32_01700 [Patescibacteria group bacterium]|nr:hypothetical protein [Patescibacteria group bacterium]
MLIKAIKHFFIIFGLLAIQVALIPNLPGALAKFNVILVSLIFIATVYRFYLAGIYGMVWGFVLDLYSPLPFAAIVVALMATLYVAYKVFEHLLTNKSFYTLLGLALISTIVYHLLCFVYSSVRIFNATRDLALIKQTAIFSSNDLLWQIAINLTAISVLFLVFNFSSRRFNAVFVDTIKT